MPPVSDKTRTGWVFGRRVMEFQNWTLAMLWQRQRDRRCKWPNTHGLSSPWKKSVR